MVKLGSPSIAGVSFLVFLSVWAPDTELCAGESPEQVLAAECEKLRGDVMSHDGFLDRVAIYRDVSASFQELGETLAAIEPFLQEAAQLRELDEFGLLDLLTGLDPSLSFIPASIDVVTSAHEVFKEVDSTSKGLMVMTSDVDRLLRKESLTIEEIQAIRSGIPEGQEAMRRLAERYVALRPALESGLAELESARAQLGVALQTAGGFGIGDFGAEIDALFGELMGEVVGFKAALDALADHSQADLQALDALQEGLLSAQAHHAFAVAQAQRDAGNFDEAKKALELLVESYPNTEWAAQAKRLLDEGLHQNHLSTESESGGLGMLVLVMGSLFVVALGFVLWSRRKEMQT